MGRSYLEAFFRHPVLVLLPVVVGLLGGLAVGLSVPRDYVAGVMVWADSGSAEQAVSPGTTPPSAVQSQFLVQLLATRSFMEEVAAQTPLGEELAGVSPQDRAAALGALSGTISVSTPGPQVMGISVIGDDPEMVRTTAIAVLAAYESFRGDRARSQAQEQARADEEWLQEAAENLQAAEDGVQQAVPGSAETLAAAAQEYADASEAASSSAAAAADARGVEVEVIDPVDAALPQPRMMTVAIAAVGGAAAGLVISVVMLVLLMVGDRTVRDRADAQRVLGVPVAGSIPELEELAQMDLSGAAAGRVR